MTGGQYATHRCSTRAARAAPPTSWTRATSTWAAWRRSTSTRSWAPPPAWCRRPSSNIVGLTTTIAAHELGHLSGLQHQDAFGPIGSGIYAGVNPAEFYPAYTGAAERHRDAAGHHGLAGLRRHDAARHGRPAATYVGERDAVKLAFNDTGTVLQQANLPTLDAGRTARRPVGHRPRPTTCHVSGQPSTAAAPCPPWRCRTRCRPATRTPARPST